MLEMKSEGSRDPGGKPARDSAGQRLRYNFDRYEDCGCVDRWEAEGGQVVGEDQADPKPG